MQKRKQLSLFIIVLSFLSLGLLTWRVWPDTEPEISGAPPYGEALTDIPPLTPWEELKRNWRRPAGPPKVALQVGHLDNHQVPEELINLKGNTGASAGGYTEREVNKVIAEKLAVLLREEGVEVEILPATVPPDYWADAFIAIHADGNKDTSISGFKIAGPWRDLTGNSDDLVKFLEASYQTATSLEKDPNVTRNMRGYYAFSWWRYDHSIHPMTTAVIVETGFLTNRSDRKLIAEQPHIPAEGLAEGILTYLNSRGLLSSNG
jgi:hypothetical protein